MSPQAVDPPKLPTAETNQAVLAAGADASKYRPNAPLASQIIGDKFRLTILTDGLIRFEWSEDGLFEDRASTFAVNRELPTPKFELIESEERVEIVTDRFHLEYDRAKPSPSGLTCLCEKTVSPKNVGRGSRRLMGKRDTSARCGGMDRRSIRLAGHRERLISLIMMLKTISTKTHPIGTV